jgi:hypothetical protein
LDRRPSKSLERASSEPDFEIEKASLDFDDLEPERSKVSSVLALDLLVNLLKIPNPPLP